MIKKLEGHNGLVKGIAWDPIGRYIVSQVFVILCFARFFKSVFVFYCVDKSPAFSLSRARVRTPTHTHTHTHNFTFIHFSVSNFSQMIERQSFGE
jgi:hypothetical protein